MNTQEEFILNCYNNCSGRNYSCGIYKQELIVHFDKTKSCSVYRTIKNDIKKMDEGKPNITYEILEKIILEKK